MEGDIGDFALLSAKLLSKTPDWQSNMETPSNPDAGQSLGRVPCEILRPCDVETDEAVENEVEHEFEAARGIPR